MRIFSDKELLFNEIDRLIKGKDRYVISVDGFLNSGKTELAREISSHLGLEHFDWDSLLIQKTDQTYSFNIDEIKQILELNSKIVIEVVLIQELLRIVNFQPTITIYVKTLDREGVWINKINQQISNEILQIEPSELPRITSNLVPYELQIIEYHRLYSPHINSDFSYQKKVDSVKDEYNYIYIGPKELEPTSD